MTRIRTARFLAARFLAARFLPALFVAALFVATLGRSIVRVLRVVLPGIQGRNPAPDRPTPRPQEYRP
jgi:hypothetical protein